MNTTFAILNEQDPLDRKEFDSFDSATDAAMASCSRNSGPIAVWLFDKSTPAGRVISRVRSQLFDARESGPFAWFGH